MAVQILDIRKKDIEQEPGPVRVLLADDNRIFLRGLKRVLEEAGCEVQACLNGTEALSALKRYGADVVVLDYRMPGLRDTEAAERIRAFGGKYEHLPIIGISVDDDDLLGQRCRACGMDEFLTKLSPPEVIEEAVLRWAKRWRNFVATDDQDADAERD